MLVCVMLCLVVEETTTSMHREVPWGCRHVRWSLSCDRKSDAITACNWFTYTDRNLCGIAQYCWGSLLSAFSGLLRCIHSCLSQIGWLLSKCNLGMQLHTSYINLTSSYCH